MIDLKSAEELGGMRAACAAAARVLRDLCTLVVPGVRAAVADGDVAERRAALPEAWGRLSLVIVSD